VRLAGQVDSRPARPGRVRGKPLEIAPSRLFAALATGLRHDELRLLQWRQIDFVNEALKVGRSKSAHGGRHRVPMA
jgi:integrase